MSRIADYMWWLLPSVRKQQPPSQSRLYGLLEAIGSVLDELKETILTLHLRRYFLVIDENHPYYGSDQRSADLDMHAQDRGLRRLPGESDAALVDRIATLGYRNQFLGTKAGMKYLVEEIFGLTCEQIVEYYADDQAWIILSERDQKGEVEANITHLFSGVDQPMYGAYRGTRIYSRSDVTQAFHFWVSISNPHGISFDPQVVIEAITAAKPAHTRAVVYFNNGSLPSV